MDNMLLKNLIENLPKKNKNIKIKGLTINSKEVKKNFIFFAIKGNKFNGEKYINEAINKGARVIICSKNCKFKNKKILIIKTLDVRYYLSLISSKFYKLKPKNLIAVTGTNGKTSVADLFYQILSLCKTPVASIGTLGIKYNGKVIKTKLTSPDTIHLHNILEKLKKSGINNVIIETSSHALHQKRVDHLNFKAGVFTNFSQDHLDYHVTIQNYLNSKLKLFRNILQKNKSVISDKSINEFSALEKISKKNKLKLLDISKIKKKLDNYHHLNLNDFQSKNLGMAIAAAKLCNLKENKIFQSLKGIKDINGRLELVTTFTNNIRVYVDFAHTPDALLKSLLALKKLNGGNISLVFGCGGNRDKKKRSLMAKIASINCSKIYVTDDNPRYEKPEIIRNEIIKNIKNQNCFNIGNRKVAIKKAISSAEQNEIILIAGKGHETEQIYKDKIIAFSDKEVVKKLKITLKIKKISSKKKIYLENKKIFEKLKKDKKFRKFKGLSIDTRTLKKKNVFITIKGKNNDGVKFIPEALKKGASFIITSKNIKKFENKIVKVKNEINFLNNFASLKRDNSNAKIFAITGSAGKTSLKNLIHELLKNFGETYCSPKSYNNHFGVPLSLSSLNKNHKYGVFEVGMSKKGEINNLTKLVRPHIGVITNIGEAHIENFKNLRGIADAKGEIINNIISGGTLILNRDDNYFNYLKKKAIKRNIKVVSYGKDKRSYVHPIQISKGKDKTKLKVKVGNQIIILSIKNINIYNVLSALALLDELNLDFKKILKYFEIFQPTEGRGKIHKICRYSKNFNLIDESYNANPISVKTAIKNFQLIKKQKFKKYLLLGDMLELGKKSRVLHKNISKVINNSDIDKVFIKGHKTLDTYKNIKIEKRGNIFQQEDDVDFTLNNIIANNDYLMIKGSNATGLNNLSKKLIKGY